MSDKPLYKREIENATPEMMREELDNYFAHVQQHDPKSLEFALMVAGHGEEDGGTHVCSMLSGPPKPHARIVTELMDELVKRDPVTSAFFLAYFLQRIGGAGVEIVRCDDAEGEDAVAQVKDLLNKLRNGSIH